MADPIITSTNTGNRRNNMTMNSQQAAARNNPGQINRSVGQMSSYGVARSGMNQIRQGDVIRGEISDLRNNEITITLENNTLIKGQIADSSSLSIGQTAAFRLSSISPSGILLDAIPNSYTETELTLINKALEEASLPATQRNQSAVKALMDNLMPINKQSIQQLMQQAYDLGTDDMETLCLMNRKQYPVTADSVAQFGAYRNGAHSLLSRAETFATQIPQLLETLSENGPSNIVAMFGEKLLAIALPEKVSPDRFAQAQGSPLLNTAGFAASSTALSDIPTIADLSVQEFTALKELLSETPMTEEQLQQFQTSTMSQKDAALLIQKAITDNTITLPESCPDAELQAKSQEILQLLQPQTGAAGNTADGSAALGTLASEAGASADNVVNPDDSAAADAGQDTDTADISGKDAEALLSGAAGETKNAEANASVRSYAGRFFHNLSDAAKTSFQNINEMLAAPHESSASVTHTPAVIDTLLNNITSYGREQDQLFTVFNPQERTELARHLQNMSVDRETISQVLSGDATAEETLTVIKDAISHSDSAAVQKLFQTEAFQKLFHNVLMENFTITPHKLAKNGEMDSFYDSMEQKMNSFETLINSTLSGDDSGHLSGQAHDMQSNIDFMKSLNEAFAYMQLPLKLQNQNTHGDLYVYTKKDKLKQDPQKLSLMLHLEMDHLGTVNVRLEKDHQNIKADFHLDQETSLHLIERNTHLLQDSLAEKGYTCQIQVQPLTQNETPVQDYLNAKVTPSASHEMKRFSFDIRA